MPLDDFLSLTPLEFKAVFAAHQKQMLQHFEYQQMSVFAGYGQAAGGKKFKSVFKHTETATQRRVTDEQKMQDLADIQNRLKGGVTVGR